MSNSYWIDPEREMQALAEGDRRRAAASRAAVEATPEMGQRAAELLRSNPNLSAGLLQALASAQVPASEAQQLAEQDDGGVLGTIGDVAGDIIEAVTGTAKAALDKAYEYGIKPAIRGTFAVADTAAQELVQRPLTAAAAAAQGEADSFGQAYEDYGNSPGVIAARNVLDDDPTTRFDLGQGFFADGQAGEESREQRTLTIRGQRADVGQAIANGVVGSFSAPGDRTYDTVAGVSGFAVDVAGDPLAWATLGTSKAVTAARTLSKAGARAALTDAGLVSGGMRKTVLAEKGRNFFGNERLLQRLADADAYDIMQSWASSPADRLDIETVNRLGKATDQAEVAEVLFEAVERGDVMRKGFYSGFGNFTKRNLVQSHSRLVAPLRYLTAEGKLSGLAPQGMISADDLGDAAGKVDSLLRQANIDRETRASIFGRMAAVTPGHNDEMFPVLRDAYRAVADSVGEGSRGFDEITKHLNDRLDEMRQYGIESWGGAIDVPYAKRKIVQNYDGDTIEEIVPTPQITSELRSVAFHMPEATDIRRAATSNRALRAVYQTKGWDFTADTTRAITNQLFKPLALLRPAYILRIGAEEQGRLAAAHYDSIYNHPFRFIMANMRNRDELKDLLGKGLRDEAKAIDIITKDAHGVVQDTAAHRARQFTTARRVEGEELSTEFVRGWQGELGQLASAPEARQLTFLRGDIDQFKTWAQAEGREHIERLGRINADDNRLLEFGDDFDRWADGLRRRIEAKTAGWDEDLVDRIANQDIPFPGMKFREGKLIGRTDGAAFSNVLRAKARQGRAPAAVKAEVVEEGRVKHMDNAVAWLFDHITGKPTSYLARYPAFRQSMLRRTNELMDSLATDELREQAFAAAVNNLGADVGGVVRDTKQMRELRAAFDGAKGTAGPIESLEDLNLIVKTKAAEDVKELLFDVTRRGAAQDTMVAIVPFLDAYKEVSLTWARLLKENPAFFIRAQAGYRELEEQGHVHVNDFGDSVFTYPGGGALSAFVARMNEAGGGLAAIPGAAAGAVADAVTGNTPEQSVALEGRVEGLNLIAQGVGPGFGPVVQWGAGMFKSPDLDTLRKMIAPFGTGLSDPKEITDPGVIAETLLPAWGRKVLNAWREGGVDERQWNSTVGDALKALAASGEYDPADQDRLLEDAERYGKWLLLARGFVQFAGPTGPSATLEVGADTDPTAPDWNPEIDPDGHMFSVGVLASEYYRLTQTYGPEQAAGRFYDMYGLEPFFIAQAKTRTLNEAPVDAEGDRWMRRNEDVVDDYPAVAGFFAPTDEDAELDFSVYAQQIERGDRQSLTPRQQSELATQVRARAMYQAVKDRVADLPPAQRDRALQLTRARIDEVYPGWSAPVVGVGQGLRVGDKIDQLARAVEDPRLADNPTTEPLRVYLRLREMALAEVRERTGAPNATLGRQDAVDIRERLRTAGLAIQQRYPSFVGPWSGVLSREVDA